MRSYSCFYRSIGKEKCQELSTSFCGGNWGGDGVVRGDIAAAGDGNGDCDIWLSKKTQGPLVYAPSTKSLEASSRSCHKINDG